MSIQDDIFDVRSDIEEHCSAETLKAFDRIERALGRVEARVEVAESALAQIRDGARVIVSLLGEGKT